MGTQGYKFSSTRLVVFVLKFGRVYVERPAETSFLMRLAKEDTLYIDGTGLLSCHDSHGVRKVESIEAVKEGGTLMCIEVRSIPSTGRRATRDSGQTTQKGTPFVLHEQ